MGTAVKEQEKDVVQRWATKRKVALSSEHRERRDEHPGGCPGARADRCRANS